MTMKTNHRLRTALCLIALILVSGCTSMGFQTDKSESPDAVLAAARSAGNSEATRRTLLKAAASYQSEDRYEAARTLLQSEMLQNPEKALEDQYRLLAMASIVALEDQAWAQQLADRLPLEQFHHYPQARQDKAARLQIETFRLAARSLAAAKTLMTSAGIRSGGQPAGDNDRIWQLLKDTDIAVLQKESSKAVGYDMQGWLELALSLRSPDHAEQNQGDISIKTQGDIIRRWQNNWPEHPAAKALPSELQLIISLSQDRASHIALALPVTGPLADAGKAVRDGFLAAFYADKSRDTDGKARIDVFDTNDREFPDLLKEIGQTDPELIIGPLKKSSLNSISGRETLPAPMLALNYLDSGGPKDADNQTTSNPRIYQFGLSAADEARQVANRLIQDDLPQAVALIPWGDWGTRVVEALQQQMANNGSPVLDIVRYDPEENLRATAAKLFNIDDSRQRAITVEQTIAQNLEFEPRRRQDIDAIVMVANPTIARQLKPLFAFYFGGNLPVYSLSTVYTGTPNASRDSDLDNVRFTDMPWVLSDENAFRKLTTSAMPGVTRRQGRLFALGADAYRLASKLPLLRQIRDSDVKGLTGVLTMTEDGVVHRKQLWAFFDHGIPKPLPTPEHHELPGSTTPGLTAPENSSP